MRTLLLRLLFISSLLLCITGARAQDAKPSAKKPAAQAGDPALSGQNPASETPRLAPELASVEKALAGKWSVSMKFEPHEGMPNGAEGHGEEVWRSGPGGFTFMEEAHNYTPFGEVFLTGFMWWDSVAKDFRGMLCTNQNPHGCDPQNSDRVNLKWEGKQLVVDIDFMDGGKKMAWHEVFFDITPTSFTQTGESGEAGGPLKRVLTIHATRVPEGGSH